MLREKRRARVAFRCHQELLNQIQQTAAVCNMTMSCLIVRILSDRLLQPSSEENVRHDETCDHMDSTSDHLDPTRDPLAEIQRLLAENEDKEN